MEKPVTLNVYDLPGAEDSNGALNALGLGFYHSGVEINGYEYSFSTFGIQRTPPRIPEFGRLREQIVIGTFVGTQQDINVAVNRLTATGFAGSSYDLLHNNCNNFSEHFCLELCGKSIPLWVNRAASIGQSFTTQQPAFPALPKTANDAPAISTPATAGNNVAPKSSGNDSIFSWMFGSFSSSSTDVSSGQSSTATATAGPSTKKQLTEKQKALLENLKQKK